MKFSGKMCFKITLKVTKNQGSTLSIEDTFFKITKSPKFWNTLKRLEKLSKMYDVTDVHYSFTDNKRFIE